jgi:hypothetical protein
LVDKGEGDDWDARGHGCPVRLCKKQTENRLKQELRRTKMCSQRLLSLATTWKLVENFLRFKRASVLRASKGAKRRMLLHSTLVLLSPEALCKVDTRHAEAPRALDFGRSSWLYQRRPVLRTWPEWQHIRNVDPDTTKL